MKHHVYCVTHVASGLKYVGVTSDLQARWYAHVYDATHDRPGAMSAAIRKYGEHAFTVEVLVTCDERGAALEAEAEWIERLGTRDPEKGFNLVRGQTGGPSVVYCVRCKVDGRVYVGVARDLAKRWGVHVSNAKRGSSLPLHRAMREHGLDAFEVTVLERADTRSEAEVAETTWILKLRANEPPTGYNRNVTGIPCTPAEAEAQELQRLVREQATDARTVTVRPHIPSKGWSRPDAMSDAEYVHAADHLDDVPSPE